MMLTDYALARRLETTEAFLSAEYAQTHARLFPAVGARTENIAGGTASFSGIYSPMTQAIGLGMRGEVTEEEVDRLEAFYRQHEAAINIEFCPLADDSLRQAFARRGYTMIEQTDTLVMPLAGRQTSRLASSNETIVRPACTEEFEKLSRVVARGFLPAGEIAEEWFDLFTAFSHQPSATSFLAQADQEWAGGGVVALHDGVAMLFATAVVTEFRGRGLQTALIEARLDFAAAQGCELAMVSAQPGSTSHRNLQRRGFRVAYTRAKLFHPNGSLA